MYKINYQYFLRLIIGLALSFSLLGISYAEQTLPKHYPQQFDFDGYVDKVNIAKQTIYISGIPYELNLSSIAYNLKGIKTSLLNLTSKTKVGVQLLPYVKGQKRVVSKIWVLPKNYELDSKPL